MLTYASLFSGAGGGDLGMDAAGFTCLAQVEIDKVCQSVLRRHWPNVPKWHDISEVHGGELPPVDVIVFGSPCQDLSIANGKRTGFDGERSGLFHEAIRIIHEQRAATDSVFPRAAIWENVPGAFNSNNGNDFHDALQALAGCGACLIEWCMVDARHWLPQRRRRVFVCAVFDSSAASRSPDPLFPFVARCVRNSSQSNEARQESASTPGTGVADRRSARDRIDYSQVGLEQTESTGTLTRSYGGRGADALDAEARLLVAEIDDGMLPEIAATLGHGSSHHGYALDTDRATFIPVAVGDMPDHAGAVSAKWAKGSGGPAGDEAYNLVAFVKGTHARTADDDEHWSPADTEPTLNRIDNTSEAVANVVVTNQSTIDAAALEIVPISDARGTSMRGNGSGLGDIGDPMFTLTALDRHGVAMLSDNQVAPTLTAANDPSRSPQASEVTQQIAAVEAVTGAVRRLTPTECERLQGWPDNHTAHGDDGKPISDSNRYRMCGNGIAAPALRWVAGQVAAILREP